MFFVSRSLGTSAEVAKSAKTWTDTNIKEIVEKWDVNQMVKLAAPEFKSATKPEDFAKAFGDFKKDLGPLQHWGPATFIGMKIEKASTRPNGLLIAELESSSEFEKAAAVISVKIVRSGTDWQVGEFRVEPTTPVASQTQTNGAPAKP